MAYLDGCTAEMCWTGSAPRRTSLTGSPPVGGYAPVGGNYSPGCISGYSPGGDSGDEDGWEADARMAAAGEEAEAVEQAAASWAGPAAAPWGQQGGGWEGEMW
jgi:hypothetical protein